MAGKIQLVEREKAYSSEVTKGVKKRIASAIDVFMQTTDWHIVYNTVTQKHMNFKMGFVTLTITDICDWEGDVCYKRLLMPWLRAMKDKYGLRKYIWKYEYQKRGNVHFHITIDVFIPYDKICKEWNKIQRKNGLLQEYGLRNGHYNANSTDVHKVWKIVNIGAYLGKYMAKDEARRWFLHGDYPGCIFPKKGRGKVWDCSTEVKRKRYTDICNGENDDNIRNEVLAGRAEVIRLKECTIVKGDVQKMLTEDQKIDLMVWKYGI